jgi:malate dehydrogenase (oxaloacetate-decarboxylating)(NADP+)
MKEIGGADAIGPILLGMKKPVHVLQLGSSVRSIYNMALIAVIDAQIKCKASVQDDVKKSHWWKRDRKEGKEA